ncbi:MAG: TetR/AcrR family transcriptional regulator [Clostridia bacterium]|nr:TetR/AcrR family transcriptional regulator [Clostridia bacterium]
MPRRPSLTRDQVIRAAADLVRAEGPSALNARRIAAALHCSTQPLFTLFDTMEEIRRAVIEEARRRFDAFVRARIERKDEPPYKAVGMAYAAFAGEEPELFRLLFMRDRRGEQANDEDAWSAYIAMPQKQLGLERGEADLFHLEMWAFVHGLAVMAATGYENLSEDLISRVLTEAYQALAAGKGRKKENDERH